jgi:hypothetical protein
MYLETRAKRVREIEDTLCQLQAKYESYFGEVSQVRESEIAQLSAYILGPRETLPPAWVAALEAARREVEAELEVRLEELRGKRKERLGQAEETRQRSARLEQEVRQRNAALDQQEESLKARSARLLAEIEEFNRRLRALGRGFGFFSNLFRMRRLAPERERLVAEQADVEARIDKLRSAWVKAEGEHAQREAALKKKWVEEEAEAQALQTKLDYLEQARPQLVVRSTVERVLGKLAPDLSPPQPSDPPCPRCKLPNPALSHFCHTCAMRLRPDRPDFAGSLEEMAEVNLHHRRFSAGMKAGQELIGLVRGLGAGLTAFKKSVEGLMDSERRYPLAKLQLDVPTASVEFGKQLDVLWQKVAEEGLALRPTEFVALAEPFASKVFTEDNIKGFFETMGEELSRQAKVQWG